MKLLYITNAVSGSGGLERVLSIKASFLADNLGYQVHIITLNQGKTPLFFDFSKKIIYHDISVSGTAPTYIKQYITGIKNIVNQVQPSVISVCDDGLKGFFVPLFLSKKFPIIYERHVSKNIEITTDKASFFAKTKAKIVFKIMDFLASKFDKFIVLTQDNLSEWNLNNIQVIPNPLTFFPEKVSDLQSQIVIAVGKHSYQKGFDRLLQSWQIVHQKNPDWKLHVYGTIDPKQGLDKLASQLDVSKSVSFFSPEKNIQDKYLQSSIFVFPSRYEGFGMVLIEAMACGMPCVSFDCPCGPKDIIQHDIDGFLVANGQIEDFAFQINKLIESQTLRQQLGANARQNVQRFLPETVINQWDELFKKLAI